MNNGIANNLLVKVILSPEMDFANKELIDVNSKTKKGEFNRATLQGRISKLPEKEKEALCNEMELIFRAAKQNQSKKPCPFDLREKGLCTLLLVDDVFPEEKIEKKSFIFFNKDKSEKIIDLITNIRNFFNKQLQLPAAITNSDITSNLENEINKNKIKINNISLTNTNVSEKLNEIRELIEKVSKESKEKFKETYFFEILEKVDDLIRIISPSKITKKESSSVNIIPTDINKLSGSMDDFNIPSFENSENSTDTFHIPSFGNQVSLVEDSAENQNSALNKLLFNDKDSPQELLTSFKFLFSISTTSLETIQSEFKKIYNSFNEQIGSAEENKKIIKLIKWRLKKFNLSNENNEIKNQIQNSNKEECEKIKKFAETINKKFKIETIKNLDLIVNQKKDINFKNELNSLNPSNGFKEIIKKFHLGISAAHNIFCAIQDPSLGKDELLFLARSILFDIVMQFEKEKQKSFFKMKDYIEKYRTLSHTPNLPPDSKFNLMQCYFNFVSTACDLYLSEIEKTKQENTKKIEENKKKIKQLNIKKIHLWAENPKNVQGGVEPKSNTSSNVIARKEQNNRKIELIEEEDLAFEKTNQQLRALKSKQISFDPSTKPTSKPTVTDRFSPQNISNQPLSEKKQELLLLPQFVQKIQEFELPEENNSDSSQRYQLILKANEIKNVYVCIASSNELKDAPNSAKLYWEQFGGESLQGEHVNLVYGKFYFLLKENKKIKEGEHPYDFAKMVFLQRNYSESWKKEMPCNDCIEKMSPEELDFYRLVAIFEAIQSMK